MKKATLFFFGIMFLLAACKKDKGGPAEPTLLNKWTLDSSLVKEYTNGSLSNTWTSPGDGETWDFQSNGHVVITDPGSSPETHNYTIQAGSKVNIDGFVFDIQNLKATSVTLYIRHDDIPGGYTEIFQHLKR